MIQRLKKEVDWRRKVESLGIELPEGAIESNESNLFADRMKDRGMSWNDPAQEAPVIASLAQGEGH